MVVCDPSANIQDLRQLVKQDTGISDSSLTKQDICDAYASMGRGMVLPPMRMSRDGTYLIDVASPLEVRDYKVLFKKSSSLGQLQRIARKVKAVVAGDAKKTNVLKAIQNRLARLKIAEPVQLRATSAARKRGRPSKNAANNIIPVTTDNVVNTKEMVNTNANANANVPVNTNAKEIANANAKIARLENKLTNTRNTAERNEIQRNLNAAREEVQNLSRRQNQMAASVQNTAARQNQMAASVQNTAARQNQMVTNMNTRNAAALSAISTAKANVSREIANIEQMRMSQMQNSKATQNALAEEQKRLKEQLRSANTEIAQQKAQRELELVAFRQELESNFEKKQKNALATIQAQKAVAEKKVANANTNLNKIKAKQELEFQERLLKMKMQEKTFLDQRLNGMLNLTEKERNDFRRMYETTSLDEVVQKASELNEQKGLNKKITEAVVINAKTQVVNATAKENAAMKEVQAAKNAQARAEQALRNAKNAAQQKAAQNAANAARKATENAARKVEVVQKEKVEDSAALVAQLGALIKQVKTAPVSSNNTQAKNARNAQIAKLEAELKSAKNTANAAKQNATAQINAAKKNANAAKRNASVALNAKAKAEKNLQNAATNAERKKLQNALNTAKRQSNNAQRKLQEELRNTKQLLTQMQAQPAAVPNTSGIAQLQAQMLSLQEQIGKQNRIPGVKPPSMNNAPKPVNKPMNKPVNNASKPVNNAPKPVNKPMNKPVNNAPKPVNNAPKPVNISNNKNVMNARRELERQQELARIEQQKREVARVEEEARKADEEGKRIAMEREEANRKIREAKDEAERRAAEKEKEQKNQEIARLAELKVIANKKANLFATGGNEAYLKKYLAATGQSMNTVNAQAYKNKVMKDIKLAQVEANAKPKGFFGGKAKPKLNYVPETAYDERLRVANTKITNVAKAVGEKADIQRLLGVGGDRAYLNAYRKSMNNAPYANINANAYAKKLKKDMELAVKAQEINGASVPKIVFVSNANYNTRLQNLNARLVNKREKNKIAAEDKAKVNSLLGVAPGVSIDYLQAFAKSRNVDVKNVNRQEFANKVKEDEGIRTMVEQLQGSKGLFKTKPKLVFVANANARRAELQKQLNNKAAMEEKKAENLKLSQEEKNTLQELSKTFGVDAAYLKAFANGASMKNLNRNALKAKINKNMNVAKAKATAVKSAFTGKYANAKPVLKFIKNANYNAALSNAKRNMNARVAARNEKNAAQKTKQNAKQMTKNTKALVAKIAKDAKVSTSYVEAFLADNAHKVFDAQKLNANRSQLNAKIAKDMNVAKMKATAVKSAFTDKYANATPKLTYIKTANYNAVKNVENKAMKTRQTTSNTKRLEKTSKELISKLAKGGPIKVDTAYVEAFLSDNAHKVFDAQKLNTNRSKLNAKIKADDELATIRAANGGGKKRMQYTKVSEYVNERKKAANARMNRSLKPNAKETKRLLAEIVAKLQKAGTPADEAYVKKFLADKAHANKHTVASLEVDVQPLVEKIQQDQKVANLDATNVKGTFGGWTTKKGALKYINASLPDPVKAANDRLKERQAKKKAQENESSRKAEAKTVDIPKRADEIRQKIVNTTGISTEAKNALVNEIRKNLTSKMTYKRAKWMNDVELNRRLKTLQSNKSSRAKMGAQRTFPGGKTENTAKANEKRPNANVAKANEKRPKLTMNAAKDELKKLIAQGKSLNSARRLLSPKYHPNKGGTKENFQTLDNAYEALKSNNSTQKKKSTQKQLPALAAKRNDDDDDEFKNASDKTFNERNAELAREKTRLVQRVDKNIPGLFGQYRRTWQSDIRQAKNKNALTAIEKLLNDKVTLRSEIEKAKISDKERSGHLRWVMQKRNDVQKRRQEVAQHVKNAIQKANENAAAAKKKANENAAAAKKKANENAVKKKANENAAAAKKKVNENAAKKKVNENAAAAKKKANENAAAAAKKKVNENAAKKKANENAAAAAKKKSEANALKKEIMTSSIGVKNRNRFVRDLNAGKNVSGVRKLFDAKKKVPKSKTVKALEAASQPKKPTAVPKAFANANKKKELAGKLRLAAKKSVAQNIKNSNLGLKSKQKLLTNLKKKKTGPMSVKTNLKKKVSSGGARALRTRKQLNQKIT